MLLKFPSTFAISSIRPLFGLLSIAIFPNTYMPDGNYL